MNSRYIHFGVAAAIFFAGFAVYLSSSAPALAPYRDMGEMISVSRTLGVAHPPGYPAYTLIGKIATLVPIANQSYRVNLISVLGGALSIVFLYLLLARLNLSLSSSVFAAFLWLAASGVWTVALVTEMYAPNLAAALYLLFLAAAYQKNPNFSNRIYLTSFSVGVLAGVRLDLVLILPAFISYGVYLLYENKQVKKIAAISAVSALFFFAGFSIYLYLMVRSTQKPFLNWNRPETIEKLWSSLTRKTHGGTLDMLSAHYAPGELFWADFKIYLKDAAAQFRWIGIVLAALGFFHLFKKNRAYFIFSFVGWLFTGPFFIYKANMPPNPHALAILEAHFLLPNVFLICWIAFGLELIFSAWHRNALISICGILTVVNIYARWREVSKRENFFGYDYARHIFNTLPYHSFLVMQKDVQLFSFWAMQYAEGKRRDVTVIARGLAGSSWYHEMRKDEGIPAQMGALRSEPDFARFMTENPNKRIFVGWEEELPFSEKYQQVPYGLVREIVGAKERAPGGMADSNPHFLKELYVYRGRYHVQSQNEFFSSDLIDDYSKAHFAMGIERSNLNRQEAARSEWDRSLALNSENAVAYYRRAFSYFQENQMPLAVRDFGWAEQLFEKTYALTQRYHSLPDVVQSVRRDWADCLVSLGVAYEKIGQKEISETKYLQALKVDPKFINARYNLAVLYWNRDWEKVVNHLRETLKMDPEHAQAKSFLPKAIYALERSGK